MQSTTALHTLPGVHTLPDDELLRRLADLLRHSRGTEADLVAHIGEVEARRLYAREASPSMYAYCTEVLHLSEAEAFLRIAAARAAREHPVVLAMLADGRLHLSAIAKLAPHLTAENREDLLRRATHRSKREVEELLAEVQPRPDVPASIRKLPVRGIGDVLDAERRHASDLALRPGKDGSDGSGELAGPGLGPLLPNVTGPDAGGRPTPLGEPRPTTIEPLSPARYKVQFTASAELREKLERLRALMRSSVPDGDLAAIIDTAVTEKLERLEARRFGRLRRRREPARNAGASAQAGELPPVTPDDGVRRGDGVAPGDGVRRGDGVTPGDGSARIASAFRRKPHRVPQRSPTRPPRRRAPQGRSPRRVRALPRRATFQRE